MRTHVYMNLHNFLSVQLTTEICLIQNHPVYKRILSYKICNRTPEWRNQIYRIAIRMSLLRNAAVTLTVTAVREDTVSPSGD
jgi:hypothetical protein